MAIHPLAGQTPWHILSCLFCWLSRSMYLFKLCRHHSHRSVFSLIWIGLVNLALVGNSYESIFPLGVPFHFINKCCNFQTNDPNMKSSQAITKFLPLMIGYFSLSVPSGLSLYWWAVENFSFLNNRFFFMLYYWDFVNRKSPSWWH